MNTASELWSAETVRGHTLPRTTKLPLLSAILYRDAAPEACIREVVRSLRGQDYARLQFIAVLPEPLASEIRRETADDPRFIVETAPANGGAMTAALRGLDAARGDFVTFLDGSSALYPQFASMHVQAHLAVSSSAAISAGRRASFRPGIDAGLKSFGRPGVVREPRYIPRLPSVPDAAYRALIPSVRMLQPHALGMDWNPSPPKVYRRFLVDMLRPQEAGEEILSHLDVEQHFAPLCHLFGGTIALNLPLSGELVAAGPATSVTPETRNLRRIERMRACFAHPQRVRTHVGIRLIAILLGTLRDDQNNPAKAFSQPEVARFFASRWPALVEMFGEKKAVSAFHRIMDTATLRQILHLAYPGRRFTRQHRLLFWLELAQRRRRLMKRR